LHAGQPVFDPLSGGRLKDLLPIAAQAVQFFAQRAAAAALSDEVDEVPQAPFLRAEFDFLEADRFRDVGVEFADLGLDTPEDVLDVLGGRQLRADRIEDNTLDKTAPDQQLVVAGPFGGGDAPVVAAAFAADLCRGRLSEILSLTDNLPLDLYKDASTVRRVRNGWMHELRSVTRGDAELAVKVAERMLSLVEGINLAAPLVATLHM
jgi:hypothetical protein